MLGPPWQPESRVKGISRLNDSSFIHRPPWFVGFPPWVGSRRTGRDKTTRWDEDAVRSVVPPRPCGSSATCLARPSSGAARASFFALLLGVHDFALTSVPRPSSALSSVAASNRHISFLKGMYLSFLQCGDQSGTRINA